MDLSIHINLDNAYFDYDTKQATINTLASVAHIINVRGLAGADGSAISDGNGNTIGRISLNGLRHATVPDSVDDDIVDAICEPVIPDGFYIQVYCNEPNNYGHYEWQNLDEGPWDYAYQALEFASAELGVEWRIVRWKDGELYASLNLSEVQS